MVDGVLKVYLSHDLAEAFASLAVIVVLLIASWNITLIEVPGRRAIQRMAAGMITR